MPPFFTLRPSFYIFRLKAVFISETIVIVLPIDSSSLQHLRAPSPHSTFSVLMIRFSSFGDIILSTAALQQELLKKKLCAEDKTLLVDWLVSKEYRPLIEDHPGIRNVHGFDRKTGIKALFRLSKILARQDYGVIVDLHQTTRTHILRAFYFFHVFCIKKNAFQLGIRWLTLRKSRWRLWGLFCFKGLWPKRFHPPSVLARIASFLNTDRVTTDFTYFKNPVLSMQLLSLKSGHYIVMPSSLWDGKCWETKNYLDVIGQVAKQTPLVPVIVGTEKDHLSKKLVALLKEKGVSHFDSVGKWNQKELAAVVGESRFYLGSDTGISHLAEALRVPALVLFGPTSPAVGFSPWLSQSAAIEASIACRPCGKDGRRCYRPFNPYLCMREIKPRQVVDHIMKLVTQMGIEKCR